MTDKQEHLDVAGLKSLVDSTIQSTMAAREGGEEAAKFLDFGVEQDFQLVQPQGGRRGNKADKGDQVPNPLVTNSEIGERTTVVAINWLIKTSQTLLHQVNQQAETIYRLNKLQAKVEEVEKKSEEMVTKVGELVTKVEVVDSKVVKEEEKTNRMVVEEDRLLQNSYRGQLCVSSPELHGKPSLAIKEPKEDTEGGFRGLENHTQTALRMLKLKYGVTFQETEVELCHPTGKGAVGRQGHPSTFIIKFNHRGSRSAWERLQHAMMTGRDLLHPGLDNPFASITNIYVNNFLTPRRAKFLQDVVKVARKEKKIVNYTVDEVGSIRVKKERGERKPWAIITSKEELDTFVRG